MFKLAKIIAALGVVAMTLALLHGFISGDFFADGGTLLENPWGIVSLVDLYVGFILFSMWIAVREEKVAVAALWIAGMMVFGFLTGAVYTLVALLRSGDKLDVLMLGARHARS
ncbi:MAG: DUF1475 domain-containing protein [Acholeplasmatales bacterium]|nr:MAG: DUF1475 domain-containing protein [Acholeplasmatales bacterium]